MIKTIANDKADYYTTLLTYKDYTFLMHLACYNTSSFYFNIKVALNFINILMSSSLSMLNSSQMNIQILGDMNEKTFQTIMIVVKSSVVINLCVCLSAAILYYFQIAERELFFKIQADSYLKLNNVILSEMSTAKQIDQSFVKFVLQEFIFLIENMHFAIPKFVKRNIKQYYYHYNIPPYIDVYVSNFSIMTKIINAMNCLHWHNMFRRNGTPEQKPNYVLSNQQPPRTPRYFGSISPILKSYSFDSYDKVLAKSAYYNQDSSEHPKVYNTSNEIYIQQS